MPSPCTAWSGWRFYSTLLQLASASSFYSGPFSVAASGIPLCGLAHDHEVEFAKALALAGPDDAHQKLHDGGTIGADHHGHRPVFALIVRFHRQLEKICFFLDEPLDARLFVAADQQLAVGVDV